MALCVSLIINNNISNMDHSFLLREKPYSTDPLDYDSFVHHITFSSIHSTLVSQYKVGALTGILASSWSHSDDFKAWTINIRKNITFENGDQITPEIVAKSLSRMAFIFVSRHSDDGVLSRVIGFGEQHDASDILKGMIVSNDQIVIKFTHAFPDFLEAISFGLYGVAHPSSFDPYDGKWIDKHKAISSGFYRIAKWTNDELILSLRADFLPTVRNEKPLKNVIFTTEGIRNDKKPDLIVATHDFDELRESHKFSGGSKSRIMYVTCARWNDPSSPCFNIETRISLRNAFYSGLKHSGIEPTTSFFPESIKGISAPKDPLIIEDAKIRKIKIKSNYFNNLPKVRQPNDMRAILNGTLDFIEQKYALKIEKSDPTDVGFNANVDIQPRMTGIRIDYPYRDVRFMFLSKEGIKLPDADGSIHKLLNLEPLDLSQINLKLWEQAIIWPVSHVDYGVWYDPNKYDLKQLNTSLPPLELQWIGVK